MAASLVLQSSGDERTRERTNREAAEYMRGRRSMNHKCGGSLEACMREREPPQTNNARAGEMSSGDPLIRRRVGTFAGAWQGAEWHKKLVRASKDRRAGFSTGMV